MSHIFISYSHQDTDYVLKLESELIQRGFNVWIDSRIEHGDTWPQVIEENLDRSTALIVVMSHKAKQSKWVQNELSRAQRKQKPIFPLLLEGEVWLAVEATQYANVSDKKLPNENFYKRLAEAAPPAHSQGKNVAPIEISAPAVKPKKAAKKSQENKPTLQNNLPFSRSRPQTPFYRLQPSNTLDVKKRYPNLSRVKLPDNSYDSLADTQEIPISRTSSNDMLVGDILSGAVALGIVGAVIGAVYGAFGLQATGGAVVGAILGGVLGSVLAMILPAIWYSILGSVGTLLVTGFLIIIIEYWTTVNLPTYYCIGGAVVLGILYGIFASQDPYLSYYPDDWMGLTALIGGLVGVIAAIVLFKDDKSFGEAAQQGIIIGLGGTFLGAILGGVLIGGWSALGGDL